MKINRIGLYGPLWNAERIVIESADTEIAKEIASKIHSALILSEQPLEEDMEL